MLQTEKAELRREMRLSLAKVADTLKGKSSLIREHLMIITNFRDALQSERLMSFVSTPLEVETTPLFTGRSMIVPCCEAEQIVPVRVLSLDELEPSGSLAILEPKFSIRQDVSRQVPPEQIDVVLVPGVAFDQKGNRLGRGKGYYDRFLRSLPAEKLTIGLAFDEMIREEIPHNENDVPVKMVITESGLLCG